MITYHKSCSTLSIYAFYKLVETQDLRWLIKDYDDEDTKLNPKEFNELAVASDLLMKEYGELTVNSKVISTYKKQILITYLEYKYTICEDILRLYIESGNEAVLDLLKEFKITTRDVKAIEQKIKGWKMEYAIHKAQKENKDKQLNNEVVRNLDREAMILEMNLKLGYNLDVKKITVVRWINMMKLASEKAKQYG